MVGGRWVALSPLQLSPDLISPSTNSGKRRGDRSGGSPVHSLVLHGEVFTAGPSC